MKFLKNKINIVISLLVVIMVVLILFSSNRDSKSKLEGIVGDTLSPVQRMVYTVSKVVSDTYQGIVKYSGLVNKIELLSNENGELKARINSYEQLKVENHRLREILNFKNRLDDYKFVGANIIGKNGAYTNEYIIDVGINNGLKNGMVVIANGGLFGMVTSVSDNWSLVSPIINGNIAVSGIVQRTNGNQGIIRGYEGGSSDYNLKMEYLPIDEEVLVGDIIVTSGLGGVYPSSIPIGEVMSVESDKRNLSKSLFIKSHVDFEFVSELFVILPNSIDEVEY